MNSSRISDQADLDRMEFTQSGMTFEDFRMTRAKGQHQALTLAALWFAAFTSPVTETHPLGTTSRGHPPIQCTGVAVRTESEINVTGGNAVMLDVLPMNLMESFR